MTVSINHTKFIPALLAPFGGKDTHDEKGVALESSRQKSWTFTLTNKDKGTHLTFRSRRPRGWTINSPVLVDLMVGCDNEGSFEFIGSVSGNGFFKVSQKSKVQEERLKVSSRTMVWLLTKLNNGVELPEALEIKGSTGCARCGRKLTNPDSIDDGLGPICRAKANKSVVSHG